MKINYYIKELLIRHFLIILCIFFNGLILLFYNEEMFYCLGQYQKTEIPEFVSTQLTEILMIIIKLTLFLSLYFSYIYIIYSYWAFINPALYKYESKYITNYILILIIVYIVLTYVLYKYAFYLLYTFFTQFEYIQLNSPIKIKTIIKLNENITLLIYFITTLALNLHLGLLIVFIIQKTNSNMFITHRKLFYLLFLLITTLCSPPDIIALLILYFFQITAFEIFIIFMYAKNVYWANSET